MKYITEYNQDWPERFERIAAYVMAFLPDSCKPHHIGSTSVPGMLAKDVIDLDIEYARDSLQLVIEGLRNAGYEHEGDLGIQGREAFKPVLDSKAALLPAHHLYACLSGAFELRKHLSFRNYLRAHPERAGWLSNKKFSADASANTRNEYIEKKSRYYEVIAEESTKWANLGSEKMIIPEAAVQFKERCLTELGPRVLSILLEGSFARGDNRNNSDIDLFMLVDSVDNVLLEQVGSIVSGIQTNHELNPAVVSIAELNIHPELFGYLRVKLDGVVLYGSLPEIDSPTETALGIAKHIAQEVLMGSRHYLAVAEPEEKFAKGKLYNWSLKPLGFALRFFHLAKTGQYMRSVRDLADLYPILCLDPVQDWKQIINECIQTCEEILRTQPDVPGDA